MNYVFVSVSGGIIEQVSFFSDLNLAVQQLSHYVKTMNPEKHDAGLFGTDGMIANAKMFLDENDCYVDTDLSDIATCPDEMKYIIANPNHHLGLMVVSPDDPLAYTNPVEAITELAYLRKDFGKHMRLYEIHPVLGPLCTSNQISAHNRIYQNDDFDSSQVEEYIMP